MASQLPKTNMSRDTAAKMVEESGSQKKQLSADVMPPGSHDQLFPNFMKLPLELRFMIMKYDRQTPRILSLRKKPKNVRHLVERFDKDKPFSARHYQVPVWLHVHSESRKETKRSLEKVSFYRWLMGTPTVQVLEPPMYYNPEVDTLHFETFHDSGLVRMLKPTLMPQANGKQIPSVSFHSEIQLERRVLDNLKYMPTVGELSIVGCPYQSHDAEKGEELFRELLVEWEEDYLDEYGYIRTGEEKNLDADGFSHWQRAVYEKTDGPWRLPQPRFQW